MILSTSCYVRKYETFIPYRKHIKISIAMLKISCILIPHIRILTVNVAGYEVTEQQVRSPLLRHQQSHIDDISTPGCSTFYSNYLQIIQRNPLNIPPFLGPLQPCKRLLYPGRRLKWSSRHLDLDCLRPFVCVWGVYKLIEDLSLCVSLLSLSFHPTLLLSFCIPLSIILFFQI